MLSQSADLAYKRLARTITVPAGGGELSFWVTRDTEPGWDFFFVEAHTAGMNDWTTLPDLNGHTSQDTGSSCPFWLFLHPFLAHYQADNGDDIQRLVSEGAQLVEVLPPSEYREDHLPGADFRAPAMPLAREPVRRSGGGRLTAFLKSSSDARANRHARRSSGAGTSVKATATLVSYALQQRELPPPEQPHSWDTRAVGGYEPGFG